MELIEGNYAPHMGATTTHGNAGYLTFFRNYASSQFAKPAVAGSMEVQTGNVAALEFDKGDVDMTVIGNVLGSSSSADLGTAPVSKTYIASGSDESSIFELGDGKSGVAYTTMWWQDVSMGRIGPLAPRRHPAGEGPIGCALALSSSLKEVVPSRYAHLSPRA
jgi:hypothetical protein